MKNLEILYLFSKIFLPQCAFLTIQEYKIFSDIYDFWASKMHFIAPKIESNWTKRGHRLFMRMQHTYFSSHRRQYRSRSIRKNCWFWSWQVDEPLWSLNDIVLSPEKEEIILLFLWRYQFQQNTFFFSSFTFPGSKWPASTWFFFFLDLKLEVVEG